MSCLINNDKKATAGLELLGLNLLRTQHQRLSLLATCSLCLGPAIPQKQQQDLAQAQQQQAEPKGHLAAQRLLTVQEPPDRSAHAQIQPPQSRIQLEQSSRRDQEGKHCARSAQGTANAGNKVQEDAHKAYKKEHPGLPSVGGER